MKPPERWKEKARPFPRGGGTAQQPFKTSVGRARRDPTGREPREARRREQAASPPRAPALPRGSTALPLRGAREQAPRGAPRLSSYRKARAGRRQGFSPANGARIISPSCPASHGGHSDGARRPRDAGHRGTPLRGAPPQGTATLGREKGPAPPFRSGHHRCYPHCPVRSQPGRQSGRNRASSAPNTSPGAV